jgi:acetylornithine deacetylase/succinyl-diaminopimelate desuccinylase-like protein
MTATGYSRPGVKTVLPAEASAWLDFRLVPDQHPGDVLSLLQSHLQRHGFADLKVAVVGKAEPGGTSIDHPLVQQVARVAAEVTGQPASITSRSGATLPIVASLQRHLNLPGVAAPDNPVYSGSRAHARTSTSGSKTWATPSASHMRSSWISRRPLKPFPSHRIGCVRRPRGSRRLTCSP